MDIDVRIYYQSNYSQFLDREEAITFLLNGALPERILLATVSPEQINRYQGVSAEQQANWRRVGGSLTVGNGRMVAHGTKSQEPYETWEPYDKQDCQVWFSYTEECGRISVSGTSRDLGTSLGFIRAQSKALEILNAAELQRMVDQMVAKGNGK